MKIIHLQPIDVNRDIQEEIPDIVERLKREQSSGNAICLIKGKGQTGKSNTGCAILERLVNGDAKKVIRDGNMLHVGDNGIITFKSMDFFNMAFDKRNAGKIIVYDEAQQDLANWWSVVFYVMSQVTSAYGYMHIILIIVTLRHQNIHGIIDLVHIMIMMKKEWSGKYNKWKYIARIHLMDEEANGNIRPDEVQIKEMKKTSDNIWLPYMQLKDENYNDRTNEWRAMLSGDKIQNHAHKPQTSIKKRCIYCSKCGIIIKGEKKGTYIWGEKIDANDQDEVIFGQIERDEAKRGFINKDI